jgi:signal transduction histidine kinase
MQVPDEREPSPGTAARAAIDDAWPGSAVTMRMRATLYAKLSVVLVALLAAVGVIYALAAFYGARHHLEQVDQSVNRDLARTLVADRNLVREGRLNEEAVKHTFHEYMTINPSIEIYLLALDGRILSYSADPGKVKRRHVSLEPIRAFLAGDPSFPLLGDDPRSHDRRKPFSVTPVPSVEAPEGYLYVVLRGERYESIETILQESYLLRQSGMVVAASLALGAVIGLIVFHVLTRRLRRLSGEMDAFRRSSFTHHVSRGEGAGEDGDEIDQLRGTFDAMAQRIVEQIEALKRQDTLRRDLVAQVSHDLRTPLTTLHGYLETLQLKSTSIDEAQRTEYLDIALSQSRRLARLVADLFELAKLEAREQRPALEPLAVPDLLQDVAHKMAIEGRRRGISIGLDIPDTLPMASGDIALIERVLDNLIDNALEHLESGQRITLGARYADGAIEVSVRDSGSGIAAEELPRLFERYYRGASTGGRGTGHAGLGLAIARRIVELHGGTIRVESAAGQGSTFTFTLAAQLATPAPPGPRVSEVTT